MPSEMPPRRSRETPEPALPQALPPFPEAGAAAGEAVQLVEMARDTSAADEQAAAGGRRRLIATAGVIAAGQLLSSVLGFVRIAVLNVLFYPVVSGTFLFALRPIQQINDLLVGGSVSGALIPTFVDYGEPASREELRRIYSTVANLVLICMCVAVPLLILAAPAIISLEIVRGGDSPQLTIQLVRLASFSLIGLGLFAATSALLYALKQVVFPAFATGIYHVAIITCGVLALLLAAYQLHLPLASIFSRGSASSAVLHARELAAPGLAIGAAVGALAEFAILLPGLRRVGVQWHPVLDLRHPAVRQILRLYGPIAAGLVISVLYQNLDLGLIGHTPNGWEANNTALASGTVLTQFPVGLVAAALSFAVLPPLTAAANRADLEGFKATLRHGIRLGLLLMVPAMVGLYVLRVPIVALLFQHGTCTHGCTVRNALAVQNYAYELPFIALDQLLIAAFYARKNTLIPNIVAVVSILFYVVVAVPFHTSIGMPALAFGDTAKNTSHALILFVLLTLAIGNLGMRDLLGGVGRILIAGAAMWLACWGMLMALPETGPGAQLLLAGAVGTAVYFGVVLLLRVEEVHLIAEIVRRRLGR